MQRLPWLMMILALGIVIRLGVVVAFPGVFAFDQTGEIHGSEGYDTYARNLVSTGVFGRTPGVPDAMLPPLYPYGLAVVYAVLGRGTLQVVGLHILLDVASMLMLYQIGKRLLPRGDAAGKIAALCYAVYPYLVFQNMTLIDTPIFMTLMYGFVLAMVSLRERPALNRQSLLIMLLAGVVLGAATLVRPIVLALLPFIGLWFLFRRSLGQMLLRLLPIAGIAIFMLVPWTVRNWQVYHTFVAMTVTSGGNFWQGNNAMTVPFFRAGYDVQWITPPDLGALAKDDRAADAELLRLGLTFLREHPEQIPDLLWTKFIVHWSIDIMPLHNPVAGKVPPLDYHGNVIVGTDGSGQPNLTGIPENDPVGAYSQPLFDQIGRVVHRFYYGGLFVLALIGMVLTARAWREVSLLWFAQISMTVVYVVFHPSTRYRVPTDPLLFLFSACTLMVIVDWLAKRRVSADSSPRTE